MHKICSFNCSICNQSSKCMQLLWRPVTSGVLWVLSHGSSNWHQMRRIYQGLPSETMGYFTRDTVRDWVCVYQRRNDIDLPLQLMRIRKEIDVSASWRCSLYSRVIWRSAAMFERWICVAVLLQRWKVETSKVVVVATCHQRLSTCTHDGCSIRSSWKGRDGIFAQILVSRFLPSVWEVRQSFILAIM